MAVTIEGIFRYRLDELSNNDIRALYDAFAEITDENGNKISRVDILRRLNDADFPRYYGYLYVRREYRMAGNVRNMHAARSEFNRRAYSFHPVCVHVGEITRYPDNRAVTVDG